MSRLQPNKVFTENESQTDYIAPWGFAPFTISIDCPPSMLNSVVFSDLGDDIIIRQHPHIKWSKLDIKQLIHWPHVEIEFFSPELSFKRKNLFEYNRYINFINTPLKYEKSEYIEQVDIIDPSNGRNCYTLNMLRCYVREYVNVLKSVQDMDQHHISIIEAVLGEFLKDVMEIDMNNTMATNTSVLFNIGKCVFLRNKKVTKSCKNGSSNGVGYCEIIIPKVETALNFFKGVQDTDTTNVTFKYLNILKTNLITNNSKVMLGSALPIIVYNCNFCNLSFKSDVEILNHLEHSHKMIPNLLCIKCKRSFTVNFLSNVRWKHVCNNNSNAYLKPQETIVVQ